MLKSPGKIIKKFIKKNPVRADLLFEDPDGTVWCLQVRDLKKVVEIDTGDVVYVTISNDLSETKKSRINNMIVSNIELI